jgi:hypothetical protein
LRFVRDLSEQPGTPLKSQKDCPLHMDHDVDGHGEAVTPLRFSTPLRQFTDLTSSSDAGDEDENEGERRGRQVLQQLRKKATHANVLLPKSSGGKFKKEIKHLIDNVDFFDPAEGWIFDINEIPYDENVSDYVLGAMKLAYDQRRILLKDLKKFYLLFTQSGLVREERKPGGRAFRTPDGHVIMYGKLELKGSESVEKRRRGVWNMDNIENHPDFDRLEALVFEGRVLDQNQVLNRNESKHPQTPVSRSKRCRQGSLERSNKRQARATHGITSAPVGSSDDEEDFNENASETSSPVFNFQVKRGINGPVVLTNDVEELSQKLVASELRAKDLEQKLEAFKGSLADDETAFEVLIQSTAHTGTDVIASVLDAAKKAAIEIDRYLDQGGDYLLEFYQKVLEKEHQGLVDARKISHQIDDIMKNPDSEMARIGRCMPSQVCVAALKKEREDAIAAIRDRADKARQKAIQDITARYKEVVENISGRGGGVVATTSGGEAANTSGGEDANTSSGEAANTSGGEDANTSSGEAANTSGGEDANTSSGEAANTLERSGGQAANTLG